MHSEVVHLISEEGVFAFRVPCEIFLVLTFSSGIEICRVQESVAASLDVVRRLETEVVSQFVSDADIQLGDNSVTLPRLESDEETVLELHDS